MINNDGEDTSTSCGLLLLRLFVLRDCEGADASIIRCIYTRGKAGVVLGLSISDGARILWSIYLFASSSLNSPAPNVRINRVSDIRDDGRAARACIFSLARSSIRVTGRGGGACPANTLNTMSQVRSVVPVVHVTTNGDPAI